MVRQSRSLRCHIRILCRILNITDAIQHVLLHRYTYLLVSICLLSLWILILHYSCYRCILRNTMKILPTEALCLSHVSHPYHIQDTYSLPSLRCLLMEILLFLLVRISQLLVMSMVILLLVLELLHSLGNER